jgi:hypothetical protein
MSTAPQRSQFTQLYRKIVKSELIEVLIPAATPGNTKTKIQLPDNQNLRFSHLMGIRTYVAETIPLSIGSHTAVIPATMAQSIFLTLQMYNGKNFDWQAPLVDFLQADNGSGAGLVFPDGYNDQKVNWPKSYIEIADPTLIAGTPQVVLLRIFYKELSATEKRDAKANFNKRS